VKTNLIKFAPLFAGLNEAEQTILAQHFSANQTPAGEAVFRSGDKSDALYLLHEGFVRLETVNGQALATLGPGSVLGEASLFRNMAQDVHAIAIADVEYGQLTDQELRDIVLQQPSIGLKLSKNFGSLIAQMEEYLIVRLSQTEELGELPRHTLQAVAGQLRSIELPAGQTLYRSGDAPQGLFLVENGVFELRPEPGADEETQVVQPGEIMGALSLLTNKAHTHNAVALEDSVLWAISAEQFQALNAQYRGLRRSLGRRVQARLGKADQAKAAARLAEMPVFSELSADVLQIIAQRMVLQHISAGERVYRVGDGGDALYLIESGEIELTAENASGVIEELARISDGGFFGEMSLFTGQIRTEDATATRNTNVWVLHKSDLDALSTQYPTIGAALNQGLATRLAAEQAKEEERFRHFELFADLSNEELSQVVQYLQATRFRQGEQIISAETPSDTLYLIEAGEVRLHTFNGGSWLLGPGECFGERSLLTNQPFGAVVAAETDVDLWALSKSDFNLLLNKYPSLAINLSRLLSQRLGEADAYPAAQPAQAGLAPPPSYSQQPGAPGTAITPAQQQMAPYQQQAAPPRQRVSIGAWYRNLSGFAKLRLAIIILLLIWLLGIAAPAALISLMQGASVASGAALPFPASDSLAAVYRMGSWEVAAQDKDRAFAIAMMDRLVKPTPTYTPHPTQTLVPTPTPTITPTPTVTPTPEPQLPAFIQSVTNRGAQAAAQPEPEEQKPALPPRAWDPRLDQLGVRVEEAQVASGQPYWRLVEAIWWNEKEAGGKHHIYVEVLDENGNRIVGQPVKVVWGGGSYTGPTEDKAWPDYAFNYQMYAAGNAYDVIVEGLPSDKLVGAGMGDLERPRYGIHVSFLLTYQRVTKP